MLGLIKKKISGSLNFLAFFFHKAGFTPLNLTFLSLFFAIFSAFTYYYGSTILTIHILAPFLLLVSGLFDALDGACARLCKKVTKFGEFMDSMADRFGEILIFSSLILGDLCELEWGLLALTLSMMVSYARARAEIGNVELQGIGLAERPERIIIISFSSFLRQINLGIILISVLAGLTVAHRIIYFFSQTKKDRNN